jgi:MYXO-CTERM domain-containing protein
MHLHPPGSRFWISLACGLTVAAVTPTLHAAGTWQKAPSSATNGGAAFGLWLLTDGRVLSHGNALNHWVILTPDKTGSYANGTWTTVAASNFSRGGAQEHVLKDGRFFEAGGEFLYAWPAHDGVAACPSGCTNPAGGSPLFKNTETYDPVTNTWTVQPDAPYDIGDTGSATLPDGRILDSTRTGNQTQIFDPASNTWSTGPANTNGNGDENSWSTLQNGGVLAVAPTSASVYDPAANKWIKTGALPAGLSVTLTAASGYPGTYQFGDNAGISLMFDGRVLAYGLGTTAIYTPGATASSPGTWALGPNMPYKMGPLDGTPGNECEDEYTVTETNGKVMVATHAFGQPIDMLIEFDPTTNTFTAINPPNDPGGGYPVSYLNLPNGQLMTTGGSIDWLYTPDGAPQDAWRPTVTSVVYNSSASNYTLTGTQLSGLINGGDEGDDMTMAENYPIVWLKDTSGNVYFCKSSNFSTMGPQVGTTPQTCTFTTPAGLPTGTYSLYVSSAGVQSKDPVSFTVGVGGTGTSTGGTSGTGGTTGTGGATGGTTGAAGTSGSGGTTGTAGAAGGARGSAGATGTGGASGGSTGTGGTTGSGGIVGSGGNHGSAGSSGAAGSTGSGGSPGSGGSNGSGGTTGSGGSNGSGGSPGTGGNNGTGSGGTGGANATGTSGCSCGVVSGPSGTSAAALGLLALVLLVARRRRAAS